MVPIYISVRLDSSRLPAKCLLEISPGLTALSFVIQRARHFHLRPIVCTDQKSFNDGLDVLIKSLEVEHVVGPKENKIKRWLMASQKFNFEKFHTVDPDDPFFCPDQVRESFKLGQLGSIVNPSKYSDSGGATEGYTIYSEDIIFSDGLADDVDTSFIKPYMKHLVQKDFQDPQYAKKQTRMTLDFLDDFIYLRKLGHIFNSATPRNEVEAYVLKNNLFDNLHLNEIWKKRQLEEGEKNYYGKV